MQRCADIQADRAAGRFTAQVKLGLEKQTNPFLRPHCPAIRETLNMANASDVDVFAEIRRRKDNFENFDEIHAKFTVCGMKIANRA